MILARPKAVFISILSLGLFESKSVFTRFNVLMSHLSINNFKQFIKRCYYICTQGGLASRSGKLYCIFIQNEIMDYTTNDNLYIVYKESLYIGVITFNEFRNTFESLSIYHDYNGSSEHISH